MVDSITSGILSLPNNQSASTKEQNIASVEQFNHSLNNQDKSDTSSTSISKIDRLDRLDTDYKNSFKQLIASNKATKINNSIASTSSHVSNIETIHNHHLENTPNNILSKTATSEAAPARDRILEEMKTANQASITFRAKLTEITVLSSFVTSVKNGIKTLFTMQ